MSTPPTPPYSQFRPQPQPGPKPRPQPARAKAAKPAEKAPPWGWLEWFTVMQTFMPAILFIPGISAVRTATRIMAYLLGLFAWAGVVAGPKKGTTAGSFPAKPWLIFSMVWLTLSLAHPNSYSPIASLGHVVLYISILSPAFWAGDAVASPQQLRRVLAVLFLCNAASATMGLGQVFYPQRLNPPVIPVLAFHESNKGDLTYETADGRRVLRPCGLTDTPGAAAPAGAATALIGLCFALRPIPWWRRLASVGLAFIGVAVIYYSQVRSSLVMLAICIVTVTGLFIYRRDYRSATVLAGGGAAMIGGALLWVARTMGGRVFDRFGTLLNNSPVNVYSFNRGHFVMHAFEVLFENPLGYGLGWWGMVHQALRDPFRISPVWVEVMMQAWAIDGGFPLLIGYGGAVVVAMLDSLRIALTNRDRELSFWAAVVVAQNLSSVALCFSYPTFLSPTGLQFWLLAATLHAADAQSRAGQTSSGPKPKPRRRLWPRPAV